MFRPEDIFAIKSRSRRKPNKCKSCLAPIFWDGQPRLFYRQIVHRFTVHRLAKFGWVPFADLRVRGLQWQWRRMQNLRRVGKNSGSIFSRLWTEVHDILLRHRRLLVVSKRLPNYVYHVSFRRYMPLNLPLSSEVVEKDSVWPPILRGGIPKILNMHFHSALTSEHVVGFGWLPFSELGG